MKYAVILAILAGCGAMHEHSPTHFVSKPRKPKKVFVGIQHMPMKGYATCEACQATLKPQE